MTDNEDNVSRAIAQLEEAHTNLAEAYLTMIREGYKTLKPRQREFVLNGLGALVTSIENGIFTEQSSPNSSTRKNLFFDPERAKEIRENAELSTPEKLAKEIGLGRSAQGQIYAYESGKVTPSNPPRGKISREYMGWLKKQGYNPFKL